MAIANAVRRGDLVAIQSHHSSTSLEQGYSTYERWHLARVTSASREGRANRVMFAGETMDRPIDGTRIVWTIPAGEKQDAARVAFESITAPEQNDFETNEAVRAAILKHLHQAA